MKVKRPAVAVFAIAVSIGAAGDASAVGAALPGQGADVSELTPTAVE